MKTTLEIYNETFLLKFDSNEEALTDFKRLALPDQDMVCNAISRALDDRTISDPLTAKQFFTARTLHLVFK